MAAVILNEGREGIAAALLAWLDACSLGIFVANHAPLVADTLATYAAIEAAFGGYARQVAAGWSSAGIDANGNEQLDGPPLTFTSTGSGLPATGYGYFLIDPTDTFCVAAELAPVPFTWAAAGGSWIVTPHLFLGELGLPF